MIWFKKPQAVSFKPQVLARKSTAIKLVASGLWLIAALTSGSTVAQDIHFSQFFNAPYAQSPANIGQFDGDYRAGAIYRQQWRSVTTPYSTFGIGGDAAHFVGVDGPGLGAPLYNAMNPLIQIFKPVSPLAWLPIGLRGFKGANPAAIGTSGTAMSAARTTSLFIVSLPSGNELARRRDCVHPWSARPVSNKLDQRDCNRGAIDGRLS